MTTSKTKLSRLARVFFEDQTEKRIWNVNVSLTVFTAWSYNQQRVLSQSFTQCTIGNPYKTTWTLGDNSWTLQRDNALAQTACISNSSSRKISPLWRSTHTIPHLRSLCLCPILQTQKDTQRTTFSSNS